MYNRQKAVDYAKKWAFKRNPNYFAFDKLGGDCTNFISQCLFYGGIEFSYKELGWFYYSLNNRAPAWTGVDELFSFAINNGGEDGPRFKLVSIGEIEIGDVVQLKVGEGWTHTLLVTEIRSQKNLANVFVTGHDRDVLNVPLTFFKFNQIRFCKILN